MQLMLTETDGTVTLQLFTLMEQCLIQQEQALLIHQQMVLVKLLNSVQSKQAQQDVQKFMLMVVHGNQKYLGHYMTQLLEELHLLQQVGHLLLTNLITVQFLDVQMNQHLTITQMLLRTMVLVFLVVLLSLGHQVEVHI